MIRSGCERRLEGCNHLILLRVAKERVHRQAQDLAGRTLRHGETAPSTAARSENRLLVQTLGIVYGRRYTLFFQLRGHPIAIRHPNRILRINMSISRSHTGTAQMSFSSSE